MFGDKQAKKFSFGAPIFRCVIPSSNVEHCLFTCFPPTFFSFIFEYLGVIWPPPPRPFNDYSLIKQVSPCPWKSFSNKSCQCHEDIHFYHKLLLGCQQICIQNPAPSSSPQNNYSNLLEMCQNYWVNLTFCKCALIITHHIASIEMKNEKMKMDSLTCKSQLFNLLSRSFYIFRVKHNSFW